MPGPRAIVIVLAGQRAGVVNPLAARAGVSHKCLAPIRGKPLLAHVLDALVAVPAAGEIRVSVEADGQAQLQPLIDGYATSGVPMRLVGSRPNLVDSVLAAAGDDAGPFIITTADNVLLTPAAVGQVLGEMETADAVLALARREDVLAAHPDGQRNFYKFRGGQFANCNIYGIANRKGLVRGSEVFRGGGQFMKSVARMIAAFGLHNIVLLRLGAFDVDGAMRRLSRRLGVIVKATRFADGALAIDVDNARTYGVCEELLAKRKPAGA
jgi:GTP:adenosylcobinamide-phosphate guanylyltransferase